MRSLHMKKTLIFSLTLFFLIQFSLAEINWGLSPIPVN